MVFLSRLYVTHITYMACRVGGQSMNGRSKLDLPCLSGSGETDTRFPCKISSKQMPMPLQWMDVLIMNADDSSQHSVPA